MSASGNSYYCLKPNPQKLMAEWARRLDPDSEGQMVRGVHTTGEQFRLLNRIIQCLFQCPEVAHLTFSSCSRSQNRCFVIYVNPVQMSQIPADLQTTVSLLETYG